MTIQHREYLNLAWTKDNKETDSANILELIKWSNHIINLFTTNIVASKDNIRARVNSFEKAVLVAEVRLSADFVSFSPYTSSHNFSIVPRETQKLQWFNSSDGCTHVSVSL